MDDIAKKVFISIKAFLERLVESEALTGDQLTEAHMAITAITYQLAQSSGDQTALERIRSAEQALATELAAILGAGSPAARKWQDMWNEGIGAALTGVVESNTPNLDPKTESRIAQQLRDFLVSYHQKFDPMISEGTRTTYQGGRGDQQKDEASAAIYITAPSLQTYLRERFPEHASTTVADVKRLMGGYSKETYIVALNSKVGPSIIVIRKDGYGLPTGSSVINEFNVLQEAHAARVPTPKPLWLEADTGHFGAAYMAVDFVKGKPAHLNVPEDQETQLKWARSLARTLAHLHRSTARSDIDVRDTIRSDIQDLQKRVRDRERSPHPGVSFGLSWLTNHLDDLAGRPVCRIHGDVGFHNILMRDNDILALLDWEFSHFSDPVEDLIYVKLFLDQINAWQAFLDVYEAESGFRFNRAAATYFNVWKEVRNTIACMGSLNSLLLPQVKDVALSVAGTIYIPKYEIAVLDSIIEGVQPNV